MRRQHLVLLIFFSFCVWNLRFIFLNFFHKYFFTYNLNSISHDPSDKIERDPNSNDSHTSPSFITDQGELLYISAMKILGDQQDNNSEDLESALELLKTASDQHSHCLSMECLADISFFSNFTSTSNFLLAKEYYSKLAQTNNSPKAHFYLALIEDEGLTGEPRNPTKALGHLLLSCADGYVYSHAALANKYQYGIGVPLSSENSVYHYYQVAKETVSLPQFHIHPGRKYYNTRFYTDDNPLGTWSNYQELIQYYELVYPREPGVQLTLAKEYYFGSSEVEVDYQKSRRFFELAASNELASAFGYLGFIYMEGKGVGIDLERAANYFIQGMKLSDSLSWFGMGFMYYHGLGLEKNLNKAIDYFYQSYTLGSTDAEYYLACCLYLKQDIDEIKEKFMENAARKEHLQALFELSKIKLVQKKYSEKAFRNAMATFKKISHRSLCDITSSAAGDYFKNYRPMAIAKYLVGSYVGLELAHSNLAYLMENEEGVSDRALLYLKRAGNCGDSDANVRVGDYYYYGLGREANAKLAFEVYFKAQIGFNNSQAAYNVGYMYENGQGVEKDYAMARFYYRRSLAMSGGSGGGPLIAIYLTLFKVVLKENFDYYWRGNGFKRSFFYKFYDYIEQSKEEYYNRGNAHEKFNPGSSDTKWKFEHFNFTLFWSFLKRFLLFILVIMIVNRLVRNHNLIRIRKRESEREKSTRHSQDISTTTTSDKDDNHINNASTSSNTHPNSPTYDDDNNIADDKSLDSTNNSS